MCALGHMLETRLATLHLQEPGLIEQRFKAGVELDRERLDENQQARLALSPDDPYVVLCVLPPDLSIPMRRVHADLYGSGEEENKLMALAIAAEDEMGRTMASIYSKYLDFEFPVKVFENEEEAREWLKLHMG